MIGLCPEMRSFSIAPRSWKDMDSGGVGGRLLRQSPRWSTPSARGLRGGNGGRSIVLGSNGGRTVAWTRKGWTKENMAIVAWLTPS